MRSDRIRHRIHAAAPVLAALALLAWPGDAAGQTVIKLTTLVPDGSIWHRILVEQATEVRRSAGGAVEIRIYAGGVAGDDPDLVRKMRIGQFHAAALSVQGLTEIDEAFRVFQIPSFFESPEESFHVLDELTPVLRQRLDEKGFVLINWGYGGWAHLYSKRPLRSAAELRARKMFMWGGEERSIRIWRANGLQPLGLASTDIMMALQTGMIEVLTTTPLAALSLQWFRLVPYQLDPGFAPLIGATVMTKRAWNALPANARDGLIRSGRAAETRFRREIPVHEERAIAAMVERGLQRTSIEERSRREWDALVEGIAAGTRGELVPADVYDLAVRSRARYRAASRTTP
jgi:TRAP-type transport system periplasmic protein